MTSHSKASRKTLILLAVLLGLLTTTYLAAGRRALAAQPNHSFGWKGEQFLLDGKPFIIVSGEMHYPRVPRPYWRDRMRKAKAMGLNTICTYVFWNLHEPKPGQFDFSDNLDVAAFVKAAQEEGLWVIVRPGPYICTEWDFGGFPAWLLSTPDTKVRSTDSHYLQAAESYMKRVGRELAALQVTRGGPIIMVQVENEYGSFGKDKDYMNAVRKMIRDAGFDVTLYTSDGSQDRMLAGGTLPDLLSVINFGAGDPSREFANFAKFRQNVPRMCGEYWVGWFDHWGEIHHRVPPETAAKGLDWMLSRGISVNLYMFHGGTSFGFMSGANFGRAYEPDISNYDYDSPLDEAGRPTAKYYTLREVIKKNSPQGTISPELPAPLPVIEIPRFELKESARLFEILDKPVRSERPQTMEALGQSYGFILYRKKLEGPAKGLLEIEEARDYALIYAGGKRLGVLDRRLNQKSLEVVVDTPLLLDILVENMGRINFGPRLVDDRKGITAKVALAGRELTGWEIYSLPMTDLTRLRFSTKPRSGPAFYRGTFAVNSLGDTFIDMRGWGKGIVWINGHNLGRYWQIGPQQSLFLSATWLKKGKNEIIVLDLEERADRSVQGLKEAVFDTPKRDTASGQRN